MTYRRLIARGSMWFLRVHWRVFAVCRTPDFTAPYAQCRVWETCQRVRFRVLWRHGCRAGFEDM